MAVHDAEASRIPWETICLNRQFPALSGGMSRRYLAADLSVAIASKLLQRNVNAQDNERLIEETFKQIESTQRPS